MTPDNYNFVGNFLSSPMRIPCPSPSLITLIILAFSEKQKVWSILRHLLLPLYDTKLNTLAVKLRQ